MKALKVTVRILVGLLCLAAAVLVVRMVLNITEGRKLDRAIAGLKARGVPLTAGELAIPCSDADNGAGLWKAAEELVIINNKDAALLTGAFEAVTAGKAVPEGSRNGLIQLAARNGKAADLMLEAAEKPCFRFEHTPASLYDARIPDYVKMLRMTRLLGLETMLTSGPDDTAARIEKLRKLFGFAARTAEGGTLISYLISMADAKTCLLFLNRTLEGREADEELLLPIISGLDERQTARWRALFAGSFRGERVFLLNTGLPLEPARLQKLFGGRGLSGRPYYWLIAPLIRKDIAESLPVYEAVEELAGKPYYESRDRLMKGLGPRDGGKAPWYAFVSGICLSNLQPAFMKTAAFEAVLLTTRAGLACRVYRMRTGHYPGKLGDLVGAGLMAEVPVDPFTGRPLVYRTEGDGFVVYSVGSNLKDENGRGTWEITKLVMDADDDWAWRETR